MSLYLPEDFEVFNSFKMYYYQFSLNAQSSCCHIDFTFETLFDYV